MRNGFIRGWAAALTASVVVMAAFPAVQGARTFFRDKNDNVVLINRYAAIEGYLRAEAPNGTTIAMPEPGAFGFRLGPKFRVFDVLGLITADVIPAMLSGNFNYVVPHLKPEYVIVSWGGLYEPNAYAGFDDKYQLVAEFDTRYWTTVLKHGALLYKRRNSDNWIESLNYLAVANPRWPYGSMAELTKVTQNFNARSVDTSDCGELNYNSVVSKAGGGAIGDATNTLPVAGWAIGSDGTSVGSAFLLLRGPSGVAYMARFAHRSVVSDVDQPEINRISGNGSIFWGSFNEKLVAPGHYTVSYLYYSRGALVECRLSGGVNITMRS